MDTLKRAATNRSLRTIQTELEFLVDASVLTSAQVAQITNLLPNAPAASSASTTRTATPSAASASPVPSAAPPVYAPPAAAKSGIATVSALYDYAPTDAGDLALKPGDRVTVLEWENADWARGRNEKTGAEGIFPRSYAKLVEDDSEKRRAPVPFWQQQQQQQQQPHQYQPVDQNPGSYGNMPVAVAQGDAGQPNGQVQSQGKKFGKKLGNAAIFGAGATMGGDLVNAIL